MIYASTSVALAALEYAVHTSERPHDSVLLRIAFPSDSLISIEDLLGGPLPANWPFVDAQTRRIGTDWLRSASSLALTVPSLVIPFERNLLLNPSHPRATELELLESVPFFFDPRLFGV